MVKGMHYELYLFNTPSHSDNEAVKTVYYLEPTIKNRKQQKKEEYTGITVYAKLDAYTKREKRIVSNNGI